MVPYVAQLIRSLVLGSLCSSLPSLGSECSGPPTFWLVLWATSSHLAILMSHLIGTDSGFLKRGFVWIRKDALGSFCLVQWFKDLVLLHLWHRSWLPRGFDPWPGTSTCCTCGQKKEGPWTLLDCLGLECGIKNTLLRMLGEKNSSWRPAFLDRREGTGLNLGDRKGSRGGCLGRIDKRFMTQFSFSSVVEKIILWFSCLLASWLYRQKYYVEYVIT